MYVTKLKETSTHKRKHPENLILHSRNRDLLDAKSFDVDIKLSSFRRSCSKSRVTEQVPKHVLEFLAPEELGGRADLQKKEDPEKGIIYQSRKS